MLVRALAFAITAVLVVPFAASARGDGPRAGKLSPTERDALRAEVQRKVQTYVTVELSTALGLDQKRALQLSDIVKVHMERRQQARQELRAEHQKLEQLVLSSADDKALSAQIKVVTDKASKVDEPGLLLVDTAKILSVKEQAKLVLAVPKVMKDIGKMMKLGRGGGGGRRGGAIDDDD